MLLLAATSPFEFELPGLSAGGFQVSSLEAVAACSVGIGMAAVLASGGTFAWRSALAAPMLVGLAAAVAAALAAPAHQGNALRFCGRLAAAGLIALLTMQVVTTPRLARALVAVLLAVGAIVGITAVLEVSLVPWVLDGLRTFRAGFHVVGGQVRASSTFVYPTVAAMYLEVVFALGLWWLVEPPNPRRGRLVAALPAVALALVAAGIIATFTRAGLLAMAASLAVVAGLRYRRNAAFDAPQRALAALAAVVIALAAISRSPQVWASRLSTDTSQDWYGARYDAPEHLSLAAGETREVPVTVTNAGRLTWQSEREPVFAMSYHWLTANTRLVVDFEGARTAFARPIDPGDTATMSVRVRAPRQAGDYVLVWDVVHEGRTWLSVEGVPPAESQVRVSGASAVTSLPTVGRLPGASNRLPRLTLWRAAIGIAAARPMNGVGPDNFRQVYGAQLGLSAWDRRVHANNMYLEALAGAGIPGFVALVWLVAAGIRHVWRRWQTPPSNAALAASVLAAGVSVAGHGLVDSFLGFTSTYVIFALVAGLACGPALAAGPDPYAHRV